MNGYEAFVRLDGGDAADWVLNSYNSGIWPGGVTYSTLEAAAVAILGAIEAHQVAIS